MVCRACAGFMAEAERRGCHGPCFDPQRHCCVHYNKLFVPGVTLCQYALVGRRDTGHKAPYARCQPTGPTNRDAGLAGGIPDCSGAKFSRSFTACVPFPGKKNERKVCGMVEGNDSGKIQGLVRYEYKGNIVEECRTAGKEHGLRVVCTQMGDIWIRLHTNGNRLAQIVLCADGSISPCPKPIDEGGLDALRCHLHMIQECFKPS